MDRLEEIKNLVEGRQQPYIDYPDVYDEQTWLISEIERLRKELSELESDYHYKTHELSEKYHVLRRRVQQTLKEE